MLPADGLQSKVEVISGDGANRGTMMNLVSMIVEDAIAKFMANMSGNTHPTATAFWRVTEFGVRLPVVNSLVEVKSEEGTDVTPLTSGQGKGDTADTLRVHMIKEVTCVFQCKKPCLRRGAGAVHKDISPGLERVNTTFSRILVLLIGFTLPGADDKGTEEFLGLATSFHFGAISEEATHGSPFTNVVLEGTDKLLFGAHTVGISEEGGMASKDLGHGGTVVDGRDRAKDSITTDVFIPTRNIVGRKGGTIHPLEDGVARNASILGSMIEGFLNNVLAKPPKHRT